MRWDDKVYFEVCDAFTTICDDLKVTWSIDTFFRYNYSKFTVTSGISERGALESVYIHWDSDGSVYDILNKLKNYLLGCLDERKENYDWSFNMKYFTKKDLKNGDVVKLRDGSVGIVITDKDVIVFNTQYARLSDYRNDLTDSFPHLDIMYVRRPSQACECCLGGLFTDRGELVYERKEVEEMTLEEICKALGKEIKIVKEKK